MRHSRTGARVPGPDIPWHAVLFVAVFAPTRAGLTYIQFEY